MRFRFRKVEFGKFLEEKYIVNATILPRSGFLAEYEQCSIYPLSSYAVNDSIPAARRSVSRTASRALCDAFEQIGYDDGAGDGFVCATKACRVRPDSQI
ncbi:hypothetical protein [Methylosinus sp. Ce-a6]|uniref:hypothetical protein n=1 Tax=Methylosinus sp. Ce-a6 TaxID=2172005 RepID=UPI00135CBA1A|nr:hypothetical protein [Methylosinus sp. Ce-a6]